MLPIRDRRATSRFAIAIALVLLVGAVSVCGDDNHNDAKVDTNGATTPSGVGNDALIQVDAPVRDATITSPVTVSGRNQTFESNVRIRIVGADGRTLADTFTTGTGGPGEFGNFTKSVAFDRGTNATGKVVVFETSAKDGSDINVVEIPVRFA